MLLYFGLSNKLYLIVQTKDHKEVPVGEGLQLKPLSQQT